MANIGIIYVTDEVKTAEVYLIKLLRSNIAKAVPIIPKIASALRCHIHPSLAKTGWKSVVSRKMSDTGKRNMKDNEVICIPDK